MPPPPPGTVVTNGVLTVKKGLASAVRQTLDLNRPWKGISSRLVELEDDESGTVTFALESRFVGMVISVR